MIKAYFKSSANMDDVESESIQLVISAPPQLSPAFQTAFGKLPGRHQTKLIRQSLKEKYASLLSYVAETGKPWWGIWVKPFREIERVLKYNGVFILNYGSPVPPKAHGSYDFFFGDEIAILYPYIFAENVVRVSNLQLRCESLAKVQRDNKFHVEHWFVFSKTNMWKDNGLELPLILEGTSKRIPVPGRFKSVGLFSKEILELLIIKYSDKGDWLLDAFAGTGTLAHVAKPMERNTILYEMNKEMFGVLKERLKGLGACYFE